MEGSGLPSVMAMPNGMTLEWGYEEKRDLVATMVYKRGATRVVEREYAYDSLARPVTRRTARQGNTVNDSFACNSRSELTAATVSGKTYGYSYDNIGNRKPRGKTRKKRPPTQPARSTNTPPSSAEKKPPLSRFTTRTAIRH